MATIKMQTLERGFMLNVLTLLSALFAGKEIIKEKTEPVAPRGTRFDWDAYYKDIENGIDPMKQLKKRKAGGYMTTKPKAEPKEVIPGVVDIKRYEYDKKVYGEEFAEAWRKNGSYKYIKKRKIYGN